MKNEGEEDLDGDEFPSELLRRNTFGGESRELRPKIISSKDLRKISLLAQDPTGELFLGSCTGTPELYESKPSEDASPRSSKSDGDDFANMPGRKMISNSEASS